MTSLPATDTVPEAPTDRPQRIPTACGCGTELTDLSYWEKGKYGGLAQAGGSTIAWIVAGKAYCKACMELIASLPGLSITTTLPFAYEGTRCGDAIPTPTRAVPAATKLPAFRGPGQMNAWLPGGKKYTGAMYGDAQAATPEPPKRKAAPIRAAVVPVPAPIATPPSDGAAIALVDQLQARIRDLEAQCERLRETMRIQGRVIAQLDARVHAR